MHRRRGWVLVVVLALAVAGPAVATQPSRGERRWALDLAAPGQFDLALAEVSFAAGSGAPRLSLGEAPGLLYVAGAVIRRPGAPRALVLVVNRRPRGSLAPDRLRLGLWVTGPRRWGRPSQRERVDVLRAPSGPVAALCRLGIGGPGELRGALEAGPALPGFGGTAAVAQAYDVACGRPADTAFLRAVTGPCAPVAGPAGCSVPPPAAPPGPPCRPCPPAGAAACPLGAARALAVTGGRALAC